MKINSWFIHCLVIGIVTVYTVVYLLPVNMLRIIDGGTQLSIYYWFPTFLLVGYCFVKIMTIKVKVNKLQLDKIKKSNLNKTIEIRTICECKSISERDKIRMIRKVLERLV